MNNVGRNDSCPCRSGKKYKKCCMNNEMVKWLQSELQGQYIDGKYIINSIANDCTMYNYLINKLDKLTKPIVWLHNPKLNANMRSMGIDELHIIIIKNLPIDKEDYFDVAHEIGHLIFRELGYPMVNVIDKNPNKIYLGTILSNTVMDPKINKNVISYGFDFVGYMKKSIRIQIPMLNRYPIENNLNKLDIHFLKCLLIEKILEWDLVVENTENIFEELYRQKYPIIYKQALEIIKCIRELGSDTPEKVRVILQKILDENRMNEYLEII